jgi:hypothetical protein
LLLGDIISSTNKVSNLGGATNRFNTVYYVTASVGGCRIAVSKTVCPDCNKPMMRGTGTTYTLGETADYIPVFCTDCGAHKVEAISHLPKEKLRQRKPPPEIKFLGIKVVQISGNSRGIQVCFSYGDANNSTHLSDTEYEEFLAMNPAAQRSFLKELGQREWDALEETRLMKEECDALQADLDAMTQAWKETDLLQ